MPRLEMLRGAHFFVYNECNVVYNNIMRMVIPRRWLKTAKGRKRINVLLWAGWQLTVEASR